MIIASYDNADNDDYSAICFTRDNKMLVGHFGDNADVIHKMITEQGYFEEYKKQIRSNAIDETISRLKQITNKDIVIIEKENLDDIARELKEQK